MSPTALAQQRAGAACRVDDELSQLGDADEYRFVDDAGNEYRYRIGEEGNAVITDMATQQEHVCVPAVIGDRQVVALGEGACSSTGLALFGESAGLWRCCSITPLPVIGKHTSARNSCLSSVVLPEGVKSIGRGAFRGCAQLSRITLPSTLVSIDDYAFSCTALESIELPSACTNLSPFALRLGPESIAKRETQFNSKLNRINVGSGNPLYCMVGSLLCRYIGDGALEVVLAPGRVDSAMLTGAIACIADGAFAGTSLVRSLTVREGILLAPENGLIAGSACGRITIEFANHVSGTDEIELVLPSGSIGRKVLASTWGKERFHAQDFLHSYDEALLLVANRLEQANLMLARLACPLLLEGSLRERFLETLAPNLDVLCVHFAARNYWEGFDCMVDSGLLDHEGIAHAIEVLSTRSEAMGVSYLLKLQNTRFAEALWDYDI